MKTSEEYIMALNIFRIITGLITLSLSVWCGTHYYEKMVRSERLGIIAMSIMSIINIIIAIKYFVDRVKDRKTDE